MQIYHRANDGTPSRAGLSSLSLTRYPPLPSHLPRRITIWVAVLQRRSILTKRTGFHHSESLHQGTRKSKDRVRCKSAHHSRHTITRLLLLVLRPLCQTIAVWEKPTLTTSRPSKRSALNGPLLPLSTKAQQKSSLTPFRLNRRVLPIYFRLESSHNIDQMESRGFEYQRDHRTNQNQDTTARQLEVSLQTRSNLQTQLTPKALNVQSFGNRALVHIA